MVKGAAVMSTNENRLFDAGTAVLMETDSEIKYQIECDTPTGTMHNYHLFPGVDLSYTTFYANSCFQRQRSMPHVLEIAYCRAGRYECEYKRGFLTYLGEGDFAVSVISSQREAPLFPTGFYDGIAIIIDTEITGSIFSGGMEGIAVDWTALIQAFCTDRCCAVRKAPPKLLGVFNELCDRENQKNIGYLRLKLLELFFCLSNLLPQENIGISAYFSGELIQKVKDLKGYLMGHLDAKISLRDLAEQYHLSLTTMKDCFRAVYGKPIHAFQREYKMQTATRLLVTTRLSVSEIAGRLGYENPNKFSTAFKDIIGASPSEYRRKNK